MSMYVLNRLRQGLTMPPAGWTLAGLLAFYVLAGLFGHDPWKTEDAIHLGVAYDMLTEGHWLAPELAGRPYFHVPLYYWSAALSGTLLGDWMPLHGALRLASGLWVALALLAMYFAARELYGRHAAAAAPLLLVGCTGLMVDAHEAQPLLVVLAAYAATLASLAVLPRRPLLAVPFLALSLAGCFLGGGLALLLPLLLLLPLYLLILPPRHQLPLSVPRWQVTLWLLPALALALLLILPWPWLLAEQAPAYFAQWWGQEQKQLLTSLRPGLELGGYLSMLPWFAWPAVPVVFWSIWLRRRNLNDFSLWLPCLLLLLTLGGLAFAYPAAPLPAILLLPPLALLATPGILGLRRGATNALDWFSKVTFTFFGLLAWLGWSAMTWQWPETLAQRALVLEPGFVGEFRPVAVALAVVVSLWWGWLLVTLPRSAYRGLTLWSAGFTSLWLLLVSLWLPWIDYGKSYRLVSQSLAAQLPEQPGCVAERDVGDAQRATFAYFARIHLQPFDLADQNECRWLLVQGESKQELAPPSRKGWKKVWEGNRQGENREKFRLYRREGILKNG